MVSYACVCDLDICLSPQNCSECVRWCYCDCTCASATGATVVWSFSEQYFVEENRARLQEIGAIGDGQYQGCAAAAVAIRVRPNKYWTRMAEQANHFVEQRWWHGRWMSRRSNL